MAVLGLNTTVIGAGIAGLVSALAFARLGARVQVLEQADALREPGAGIQISPNAAVVLQALGVWEQVAAMGTPAASVVLRDGFDGNPVLNMRLAGPKTSPSFLFIHRGDLIDILGRAARDAGVSIRFLQDVTSFDADGDHPGWRVADGARSEAQLVIGADGLHSRLRGFVDGPKTEYFTGQVAWRCVIPLESDAENTAEVYMGPGRHLVSYPLRHRGLRNVVAIEERKHWGAEGWSFRDETKDVLQAFSAFDARPKAWLSQANDLWLWGLCGLPVAKTWYRRTAKGGFVILGDAAHPSLPFLAQGAAMAIEDAYILARCVAQQEIGPALAQFQGLRLPRTAKLVAASQGNARAYHLSGLTRGVAHLGLRMVGRFAPQASLGRFDWLYRHDVTKQEI